MENTGNAFFFSLLKGENKLFTISFRYYKTFISIEVQYKVNIKIVVL